MAALGEEFKQASSKGLGSDDLAQVATAAASGRVATLLIEADRQIIGRLHATTGQVELAEPHDSKADELLDELGELTAKPTGIERTPRTEEKYEAGEEHPTVCVDPKPPSARPQPTIHIEDHFVRI